MNDDDKSFICPFCLNEANGAVRDLKFTSSLRANTFSEMRFHESCIDYMMIEYVINHHIKEKVNDRSK